MRESVCVCVRERSLLWLLFLIFQHAVDFALTLTDKSFYCDELMLPDYPFLYLISLAVDISWVFFCTAADRVLT